MTTRLLGLLALTAILVGSGCAGMAPRWDNPGTLMDQRNRAIVHDPYPSEVLGPAVEGGRPREFTRNLAEPEVGRVYVDSPFFVRTRPRPDR